MSRTKQLTKLLKSINDLTSNKPRYWERRRRKRMIRALVMGTAHKFLFRAADNNDVIKIHKHIEKLEQAVEKNSRITELQATRLQRLTIT
jgi:hypothetical protein